MKFSVLSRQLDAALERCAEKVGQLPQQIVADGDYTNHASVHSAAERGVDFYGSWQNSWKASEQDALGRKAAFGRTLARQWTSPPSEEGGYSWRHLARGDALVDTGPCSGGINRW